MKNFTFFIKRQSLFCAGLFMLMAGFSACKNVGDDFHIIVDPQMTKAQFSIQFVDAQSQQPIGMDEEKLIQISIVGKDADKVCDVTGVQNTSYIVKKGFLNLGISINQSLQTNEPIRFTIVAQADGYLTNCFPVIISGDIKQLIKITMVNKTSLPEGVTYISDNSLISEDGRIGTTTTIRTSDLSIDNVKAGLTVFDESILVDNAGTSLNGQLNTEMTFFSCTNDQSMASFPGGLLAFDIHRGDEIFSSLFASAGFISIEITDQSGRKAATINGKPLQLDMEIPGTTFNPLTNTLVQTGDTVPLWSMDINEGFWRYESTNPVQLNRANRLNYTCELNHLTLFNVDWPERNLDVNTLEPGSTTTWWGINNRTSNGLQNGDKLFLNYKLRRQTDNTVITESFLIATIGNIDTLVNVLCDYPIKLELFTHTQSTIYETDNLCGVHEIDLSAFNILSGTGNVIINIIGHCAANPDLIIQPSMAYYFQNITQQESQWNMGFTDNGTTTISQVNYGDTYLFGLYFEEQWYEYEFIFAEEEYDFIIDMPESYCQ
jgi:hypothetical protein